MNLPKGHLSPSQVSSWLRCPKQYEIFQLNGHIAPPGIASLPMYKGRFFDKAMEAELRAKLGGSPPMADEELLQVYMDTLHADEDIVQIHDLDIGKLVDSEAAVVPKLFRAARPWRERVEPIAVQAKVEIDFGGVPFVGYLDLMENERITDVKRTSSKSVRRYTPDTAANSIQLVPYAVATGRPQVAWLPVVEQKFPTANLQEAYLVSANVARVEAIYNMVAENISAGRFPPVDKSGGDAWVCSARWCGAWSKDARDYLTNQDISCPFGQKSSVSVGADDGDE